MELKQALETIEQALNAANKMFTLQDSAVIFTALTIIKTELSLKEEKQLVLTNKKTKSDE